VVWCCLYGGQNDHGDSPILPSADACLKTSEICVCLCFSFFLQDHVRNVFTLTPRRYLEVLSFNFVYLILCLRREGVVGWISWGKREDPKLPKKASEKIPRAPAPITTPTRRWPASQSHRLQRQVATLQYTIDPSEACTQCYHDVSMAVIRWLIMQHTGLLHKNS
jgi:hypothetical protein